MDLSQQRSHKYILPVGNSCSQNVDVFNLQCLYHHHYKYREEILLIAPSLSQLDTTKYAHTHKYMLAHLVSVHRYFV